MLLSSFFWVWLASCSSLWSLIEVYWCNALILSSLSVFICHFYLQLSVFVIFIKVLLLPVFVFCLYFTRFYHRYLLSVIAFICQPSITFFFAYRFYHYLYAPFSSVYKFFSFLVLASVIFITTFLASLIFFIVVFHVTIVFIITTFSFPFLSMFIFFSLFQVIVSAVFIIIIFCLHLHCHPSTPVCQLIFFFVIVTISLLFWSRFMIFLCFYALLLSFLSALLSFSIRSQIALIIIVIIVIDVSLFHNCQSFVSYFVFFVNVAFIAFLISFFNLFIFYLFSILLLFFLFYFCFLFLFFIYSFIFSFLFFLNLFTIVIVSI